MTTQRPRLSPSPFHQHYNPDNAAMKLTFLTSIGCLILALTSQAQRPTWTQISPTTSPRGRVWHGMSYDAARQRTVLFGGTAVSPHTYLGDTWEWDGKTWSLLKPATSPSFRSGPAMLYDSARRLSVLFGGVGIGNKLLNDTWTWNGNVWKQIMPTSSPPARGGHAMAYDSARQRIVLFGGLNPSTKIRMNDTWEWDGNTWTKLNPSSSPSARYDHAMVYDAERRRTVLFAGLGISHLADTWEWDGTSWKQLTPKRSPSKRYGHAMAYDAGRRRSVVFGGSAPADLSDTWEWDGTNWTQINANKSPSARVWPTMSYDSLRKRMVLFGGANQSKYGLGDTWEYDGPYTSLVADTSTVSLATHGVQTLSIEAGQQHANKLYFLFGTLSGTKPGISLTNSLVLPLNYDAYLNITLAYPNGVLLTNSFGKLDAFGMATAKWTALPFIPPALVGKRFHHAYVVIGNWTWDMASNAVPLTLVK